jgi:hypothetical protein
MSERCRSVLPFLSVRQPMGFCLRVSPLRHNRPRTSLGLKDPSLLSQRSPKVSRHSHRIRSINSQMPAPSSQSCRRTRHLYSAVVLTSHRLSSALNSTSSLAAFEPTQQTRGARSVACILTIPGFLRRGSNMSSIAKSKVLGKFNSSSLHQSSSALSYL